MKQALHPPSGILFKRMLRCRIHAVEGSNCPSTPSITSSYDITINGGSAAASLRQRVMKHTLHSHSETVLCGVNHQSVTRWESVYQRIPLAGAKQNAMGGIKQDGKSDFVIGDGDSKRAAVYVSVIAL